jgi:conjugal transfer mating pair stabilization protein TraG
MIGNMNQRLAVDPVTCRPLLDLIAQAESRGNYNAYFGNASNTEVKFTEMSVAEVLDWQKAFVAQGNPSSAVGRYQIINTTLAGLVQELDLQGSEMFDEAMQDRLALALLERRGVVAYINGRIDAKQFAAELAKEWAGLPRILGDAPEKSYYAGDGLNAALVGADEVLRVVGVIAAR